MNRKDVQLLILVAGILAAVLSWQFVYKSNQTKAETIRTENTALRETVTKLEAMDAQKDTYLAETERMKQECTAITDAFPSNLLAEDEMMYLYNMENMTLNQVVVPSIGFGQLTEITYDGSTNIDGYEAVDEGIRLFSSQSNVSYVTTYSGLKNMVNYVYSMPGRKSISSINVTAGSDGYLSGTMSLEFYAMTGTEKLYVPMDIPGVGLGKSNLFGVLNEDGGAQNEDGNE